VINRENWADTRLFLAHYERIGRDAETIKRIRGILRHLLEWADATPFPKARSIDPAFPTYLLTARGDGKDRPLSAASMKKACEYSRMFFEWIRAEHLARYKLISVSWIDTIRPSVRKGVHSEFHEHKFWELAQVRAIAQLTPRNLTEERDQAAVCFMYLSAMRVGAFVSMPAAAVDLQRCKISQFPELGVHTKNGKAALTDLLRLPDLLAVVQAWDAKVRAAGALLWFPRVDRWHRFVGTEKETNWMTRKKLLNQGIRGLCERAGVPYLSSHKLRHGHTVFMMRRVRDMKQLKSLSQNLMHSSVAITDAIYGRLVSDDIADLYKGIEE
jgi:site-specific recombinase XerD